MGSGVARPSGFSGKAPAALLLALALNASAGCATVSAPAGGTATPADPGSVEARLALGRSRLDRGDRAGAAAELREALRLLEAEPAPGDDAARAEADLAAGRERLARGDMTGAATALRRALARRPDLVDARIGLGIALHGMGDVDAAVDELRATVRRDPALPEARLALAAALIARRDWTGAEAELREILTERPDTLQAHYSLGVVRYATGDLPGAIEAYRRAVALAPEHHDARYRLALMLKLARRDAEAVEEFLAAARAGVPAAQYFLGAAYVAGSGAERDLTRGIGWLFRAAEQGVVPAEETLGQLRQTAAGLGRRGAAPRETVEQAFRDFRVGLWSGFPELAASGEETIGGALLAAGRGPEAVPMLVREALALSDAAERRLESLYLEGAEPALAPHDPRILAYLRTAAGEGRLRARLALARIYALGLGVTRDVGRATRLLRATPHEDAQRLLRELSAASEPAPARP